MSDPTNDQRLGSLGDQNINSELDHIHIRLNGLVDFTGTTNVAESIFSSPGVFNWTVPEGITKLFISATGPGGGGGETNGTASSGGGGGGSGGAGVRMFPIDAIGGETLVIFIPRGGAPLTDGTPLTIKRNNKIIFSLVGGLHGTSGNVSGGLGGAARLNSGAGGPGGSNAGTNGVDGEALNVSGYNYGAGASGGLGSGSSGGYGGGGASLFAVGGTVLYGSGGNGGVGAPGTGGNGGDGFISIIYFS